MPVEDPPDGPATIPRIAVAKVARSSEGAILAFGISLIPVALWAAEQAPSDNLETVVVSASRSEQRRDVTGTSISVISAGDLTTEHIDIVTDALRQTPGLTVVQNGGPGQFASIGLRGAAAGQTLVLIDGVRINDPSAPDTEVLAGDLLVNILPPEVDLDKIVYKLEKKSVRVTDGSNWHLDISELAWR